MPASQGANLHDELRGETPGASGARGFLETIQAVFEETLVPEADDLAAGVDALGDQAIGEALGGEENDLGADNLEMRQRIAGGPALQLAAVACATCGRQKRRTQALAGDPVSGTLPR